MRRFAGFIDYFRAPGRLVVLALIALTMGLGPSDAGERAAVSAVRIGLHGDTTRFVAEFSKKQPISLFLLADPYRVVIDLPALDWKAPGVSGRGLVGAYRYGNFRPGEGRLVLDLSGPAKVSKTDWISPRDGHGWRLLLDLSAIDREAFLKVAGWPAAKPKTAAIVAAPGSEPKSVAVAEPPVPEPKPVIAALPAPAEIAPSPSVPVTPPPMPEPEPVAAALPKPADPLPAPEDADIAGLPVIVVDPGHGGIDPGASASDGTFEKDVVLAVATQLGDALRKAKRYNVHMTRSDDTFLKLTERVDLARHSKADLFISLHADALASDPKVGGLSVYTLSENASDKEAEALASKENRADVIAGVDLSSESDDVTMILIDLAQRETMNQSIQLAHSIGTALQGDTQFVKNSIRQAGFRVLKAPDVCSILIELGYLSNPADLARIKSDAWRAVFAQAMLKAIDQHFALYGEQRSASRH